MLRADADGSQLADHLVQHGFLAAKQMRDAGDVEHQPVAIRRHQRRNNAAASRWRAFPARRSASGSASMHDETGDQGLRLARRHAGRQTFAPRGLVGRQHHAPAAFMADQDEGRIKRRRVRAHRPPQPVGGPARQE